MSQLIPFSFDTHEIRVTDQNGTPWFVLRDLIEAMESKTTTTAAVESIKQGLGGGFASDIPLPTAGGTQQTIIVAESAATYLLSRSNTDKGRELNRFIHVDVLPTLRKTGSYSIPVSPPEKPKTSSSERERLMIAREAYKTAKLFGFDGNMAILSAENYVRNTLGGGVLANMGATHLLADERGKVYTPTELGKMCSPPLSAVKFNLALEMAGLQKKELGGWLPADSAEGLFEWADTGKRHSNGTPVKQLRWFKAVLEQIAQCELKEVA